MQSMRWPKLFWVSACAPLASVIISTLLVFLFKAQNHGISIVRAKKKKRVKRILFPFYLSLQLSDNQDISESFPSQIGQLKCGLNRPSWDKLLFDPTYLGLTMKTGLITGILSLTV